MARRADARAGWIVAAVGLAFAAPAATLAGVRASLPVTVRARLDLRLVSDESLTPSGDFLSRSPADSSRFMTDVTAGDDRFGRLYLKGAASWNLADDAFGRPRFGLDQGDYLYRWRGSADVDARVFGDERRFFTGEVGIPLADNDVVSRFQHRLGLRMDASRGAVGATYLLARLDEGDDARKLQLASVRAALSRAFASLSYVHDAPARGADHAIARGEAGACVDRVTAIASYEQSGFGEGTFLPPGSWDHFERGHYASAAPANSATFAEVRARHLLTGKIGWIDASYRYQMVGPDDVDDLVARLPGTVTHDAWVDWSHRRLAFDARLSFHDEVRFRFQDMHRRSADLSARAFLRDNSEVLLRGGAERDEIDGVSPGWGGFVHGSYGRSLQRFAATAHAMLDGIGIDAAESAGLEGRINWNATSALYVRWIVTDAVGRAQSVFARLEFRPTRRTWLTIGYGRLASGNGPYLLEDGPALPTSTSNDVVTLTLRGDL